MPNNIFHKRSLTPGSVPTTSSLNVGEIAINVPDGKIFVEKSGSAGQSVETVLVSNTTTDIGVLTLSGSLILSGSGTGSVLDVSAGNIDFDFDTLSFSGSAAITGSLTVTGGIKGSLTGTSSYASQALSSSYALSASYSTIALNASMATSSSYAVSASWAPSSGGASGVFGISNSSGVYTYYATLTLAMAAAVSGNVVEMFANYTETGAVSVTLKNGVNINGNGYTYTLNNSGTTNTLTITNSIVTSCKIINITFVRSGNTTTATNLSTGINSSGVLDFTGSVLRNTGGGAAIYITSAMDINNLIAYGVAGNGIRSDTSAGTRITNCIGYATGGGAGIYTNNGGDLYHCTGYSDSGIGIYAGAGMSVNCVGVSVSGVGMTVNQFAYNCVGRSNSSYGFQSTNATILSNCSGYSVSGGGLYVGICNNCVNCYGWSSSNYGVIFTSNIYAINITSHSISSASLWAVNVSSTNCKFYGGHISTDWNNVAAYGIRGWSNIVPETIVNCVFRLSNSTAPYIFNDNVAFAITMRGNTYRGGGAFNANLTQAITTTADNQGNIYL